jgi:hypothetical protein
MAEILLSKDEIFLQALKNCTGRYIEVVTGRNAYTINKEKHALMLKKDGMYILLEKPPEEGMKQVYDKAIILPANVVNSHFTTSDPALIKTSFHLPGDKMRFKFHAQIHKIYEFLDPSFIIKVLPMGASRRMFKVSKSEVNTLIKNRGKLVFLCVTNEGRLLDIIVKSMDLIGIPEGRNSKEIPIDLSGEGVERLKLFRIPLQKTPDELATDMALDHPFRPEGPVQRTLPDTLQQPETMVAKQFSDLYFHRGTEIILTLPEGKESLVLKCMITGIERVQK